MSDSKNVNEMLVEMFFDIDKKRKDTEYMNDWKDGYNSCLTRREQEIPRL